MLRNAVKAHWVSSGLPIGSFARSDGYEIRYEAASSEIIDADEIMKQYENGDITREQFLRMISIQKTEAKNVLGGDQVAELTVTEVGKKLDIRLTSLPVENLDDAYVMENSNVKKRIKRRVFGNKSKTPVSKPRSRKRNIKTRTKTK